MYESKGSDNGKLLSEWQKKIELANRNNIFCHCRSCGYQWVVSSEDAICGKCGSQSVQQISCWQFPDD